jgi:hypothetical protein
MFAPVEPLARANLFDADELEQVRLAGLTIWCRSTRPELLLWAVFPRSPAHRTTAEVSSIG